MLTIRQFTPSDLEALYAISLETGHEGGDASRLYHDGRLIGHIYSAPYAILEPGLTLVVEDKEGVAGFAVGALETNRWQERLEAEWWPKLRQQYDDPSAIEPGKWSADQRRAFAIHHPEYRPQQVTDAYPAHLHLNLSARIQGHGTGTMLFCEWMARASKYGLKAMHVGVNRGNVRAVRFWSKQGFKELQLGNDRSGGTIWMGRPRSPFLRLGGHQSQLGTSQRAR